MSIKPIAIQLYTLREAAEKDFYGTLKIVADTGYKGVEFAGLYDKCPKEVAAYIADLGMSACSAHVGLPDKNNIAELVDMAGAFGMKHLVSGFGPDDMKTVEQTKACAAKFAEASELCEANGLSFSFHNHYWEFKQLEDGRYPYDILMAEAPKACSELDLYWVAFGGGDAIKVFGEYGKRIKLIHVKDGLLGGEYHFAPAGKGQVDLAKYIGAADCATAEWMIVEQDMTDGDMVADIQTSYKYLVSNGLAVGNK